MKMVINQKVLIIALLVVVLILAGYIGLDSYNGYIISTMQNAYSVGYQDGVAVAVQQIIVQSENCNPVPVYVGNVTKNLIDLACLQ